MHSSSLLGGAQVLGRDDIGSLEVGKAADFIGINMNRLNYAGNHDPIAAVLFGETSLCRPFRH